jgi:hypothetical protein
MLGSRFPATGRLPTALVTGASAPVTAPRELLPPPTSGRLPVAPVTAPRGLLPPPMSGRLLVALVTAPRGLLPPVTPPVKPVTVFKGDAVPLPPTIGIAPRGEELPPTGSAGALTAGRLGSCLLTSTASTSVLRLVSLLVGGTILPRLEIPGTLATGREERIEAEGTEGILGTEGKLDTPKLETPGRPGREDRPGSKPVPF